MEPIDLSRPWPLSKEGNQYLCVLQDYFSKRIEVYAMPDKMALSVAKCLVKFMARYGRVDKLHSDLGMEFQASVSKHLYELWGVHKTMVRWTGRARKQDYPAVAESIP